MYIPKIGRRAAVLLGKTAGALLFAALGGTVTWLLDQGRRRIQEEAVQAAEEPETVMELPREAEPETEAGQDEEA